MRVKIIFLATMLILASCHKKQPDETQFQRQLREAEEQLSILHRERSSDSLQIVDLKRQNQVLLHQDSLYRVRLRTNELKINQIKKEYAKTDRFNNYSSSDIAKYFRDSL